MSKKPKLTSLLVLLLAFYTLSACGPPGDDRRPAASPSANYLSNTENSNRSGDTEQGNGIVQTGSAKSTETQMAFLLASSASKTSTQEVINRATAGSQTETAQIPTATITPSPTWTPLPTATSTPTETATPTRVNPAQSAGQDCSEEGGGRQKVRIENNTGGPALLYLNGENSYTCSIASGVQKIFVVSGSYNISALMCENQLFTFGSHVINPTWVISLDCP